MQRFYKLFSFILLFSFSLCQSIEEVNNFCNSLSDYYNAPKEILPAIIRVESDYIQNSISSKGAYGLMQVTYNAFLDYKKINPNGIVKTFDYVKTNWKANCRVGAWYLYRVCYRQNYNYKDAITKYFWGINHTSPTDTYYQKVQKNVSKKH